MKAGQVIQVAIRDGINSDEGVWGADTAQFRPERWLEEESLPPAVKSLRAQGNLYTFGDGLVAASLFAA